MKMIEQNGKLEVVLIEIWKGKELLTNAVVTPSQWIACNCIDYIDINNLEELEVHGEAFQEIRKIATPYLLDSIISEVN